MGKVSIAKNTKRIRVYVDQKGITVPEFEKNNTRRNYEVVGESCRDEIAEKATGALAREEASSMIEKTAPQSAPQPIEDVVGQSTIEDKGKKMVAELEDLMLEELKTELLKDDDFKAKMKAKLLKKLFK